MDRAEKITRAFGRAYDSERRALLPSGSVLRLTEHVDGVDTDKEIALLTSGWRSTPQRQAGRIEAGLKIQVVETAQAVIEEDEARPLTKELVERCHRLTYTPGGAEFIVTNFDIPSDAPREWVLWAEELVVGGAQ